MASISNRLAARVDAAGWQTLSLCSRRVAQVLTLLLVLVVMATAVAFAATVFLPHR